ncbi:hypothetical protein CW705_00445 [Candidatus Bathyarchaeota archaeon]|nr:MAG: hypothetical protein CW705_00445 [Candidatus Bathyarchaeota archaeon]
MHRSVIKNLVDLLCAICFRRKGSLLIRTLGTGILLKKEGWLIAVYHKCGDRFPKVSIRRNIKQAFTKKEDFRFKTIDALT